MILNTDHLRRCIQTLRSSLAFYEQAESDSIDREIFRNAIVKGYELAQETSFKLVRKALRDYGHGAQKLDRTPIKEVLRLAATFGYSCRKPGGICGMTDGWRDITLGDFVALQRGHDLTEPERRAGRVPVMGPAGQNGFHDAALAKGPGIVIGRSGASFGQVHFSEVDF